MPHIFNKRVLDFRWKQILFGADVKRALLLAKENHAKAKQKLAKIDFVGEWLNLLKEYDSIINEDKEIGEKPFEKRFEERQHSAFLIHEIRAPLIKTIPKLIQELENKDVIKKSLARRKKQMLKR